MIDYSVSARPNPREKNTPPRYYESPQVSDNVSMNEFCRHIASHGSVYSRADVQSVLSQAVDCLREMLLAALNPELTVYCVAKHRGVRHHDHDVGL